jgi:hypothetical protein
MKSAKLKLVKQTDLRTVEGRKPNDALSDPKGPSSGRPCCFVGPGEPPSVALTHPFSLERFPDPLHRRVRLVLHFLPVLRRP